MVRRVTSGAFDRLAAGVGDCGGGGFAPVLGPGGGHSPERNRGLLPGGDECGWFRPDATRHLDHQRALGELGYLGGLAVVAGAGVWIVVTGASPRLARAINAASIILSWRSARSWLAFASAWPCRASMRERRPTLCWSRCTVPVDSLRTSLVATSSS